MKNCNLCLESTDIVVALNDASASQTNVKRLLDKYFSDNVMGVLNFDSVCLNCCHKITDFDEFCVHIGNIHQQFFSQHIKEEVEDSVVTVPVEEQSEIDENFKHPLHALNKYFADPLVVEIRKRGRPRKSSSSVRENDSSEEYMKRENEQDFVDRPPRKRGRPRKTLPMFFSVNSNENISEMKHDIGYIISKEETDRVSHESRDETKTGKANNSVDFWKNESYWRSDAEDNSLNFFGDEKNSDLKTRFQNGNAHSLLEVKMKENQSKKSDSDHKAKSITTFVCELCGHFSLNRTLHEYHFELKHLNKVYECDICDYRTSSKLNIKTHIGRQHIRKDHEKFVRCDICDLKLTKRSLSTHKRLHDNEFRFRFKCSFCFKGFAVKRQLQGHEATHTGDLPLECADCGERFRFTSTLSHHRKKAHKCLTEPPKKYKCYFCNNVYSSPSARYTHRKRHHPNEIVSKIK